MKVNIEREIDVNRLLINLSEKSACKDPGMVGYQITVDKQLLRDAHDVISQFKKQTEYLRIDTDGLHICQVR